MLRIAICEDLPLHQKYLSERIQKLLDEPFEITAFSSAEDFKSRCVQISQPFDIIFMDIELGDGSGIGLSREINQISPASQIIYITAYAEYSSDVYTSNHVWFIDKRRLDDFLPLALEKALHSISLTRSLHLNFSWQKISYAVPQKEIIYIERSLRVSVIHTVNQTYRTSDKLELLLKQLTDAFILCHRSYIINMTCITTFQKDTVILNGKYNLPVSRSRLESLKNAYSLFLVR